MSHASPEWLARDEEFKTRGRARIALMREGLGIAQDARLDELLPVARELMGAGRVVDGMELVLGSPLYPDEIQESQEVSDIVLSALNGSVIKATDLLAVLATRVWAAQEQEAVQA